MKQKKLLSLGIILFLALSQLYAQKGSPPLTLKSGDWFETGIRIRNVAHTFDYNFNVRYEVMLVKFQYLDKKEMRFY